MSKNHTNYVRGFSLLSAAYYGETILGMRSSEIVDEITIGFYSPDGGTSGEFCVEWAMLGGAEVPQLRAYEDSWWALAGFSDVLAMMGAVDGQCITPEDFCELLLSRGVVDRTQRIRGE